MFTFIMWVLAFYCETETLKQDKKGRQFLSYSFKEEQYTTTIVKSLVVYPSKNGGYRLLANLNRGSQAYSVSWAIKPNRHSWAVIRAGKYEQSLYNNHFRWSGLLPGKGLSPQGNLCPCKGCKAQVWDSENWFWDNI